jgi:hypothetical protein
LEELKMKITPSLSLLISLIIAIMLVGCHPKQDARITELQRNLDALRQSQLTALSNEQAFMELVHAHITNQDAINTTFSRYMIQQLTNSTEGLVLETLARHEAWIAAVTNGGQQTVLRKAALPATVTIPSSVHAQIVKDAAARWPGNYQMQEFVIKEETESYRRLHP